MRPKRTTPVAPDWAQLLVDAVNTPGVLSDAYRRFWNFSIGNQLLAIFECLRRGIPPGPIHTFRGWLDLGRHVKKGEKAITLCMPVNVKAKSKRTASSRESDTTDDSDAGQHKGRCPLPTHPKESGTSLSFSANIKKKVWRCFGCNTSGNVLDFAVRMEGYDPKQPADVRKVALLLQERFATGGVKKPVSTPKGDLEKQQPQWQHAGNTRTPPEVVNPPLDFALKNLNAEHDFFRKRGIKRAAIEHFGLGYCTKGMLAGRIAIPLHNSGGKLVGYAGRLTDEFEVTEENVPYLWPGARERNGVKHIFDRSKFLYHGHAIQGPVTDLIIVQSVESVWHLWQCGFPDTVGLMESTCSSDQASLICELVSSTGRVWILTDGSKTGDRCAHDLFEDVGSKRFCTWLRLSEGQPTDCRAEELAAMLEWKIK